MLKNFEIQKNSPYICPTFIERGFKNHIPIGEIIKLFNQATKLNFTTIYGIFIIHIVKSRATNLLK